MEKYAEIVVPVARDGFTFSVGEGVLPGQAIEVCIGPSKRYVGIVWRIHNEKPAFATKPAGRTLGSEPLLTPQQMSLWEWIAEYYMCTLGDVMRYALPAGIRNRGSVRAARRIRHIRLSPAIDSIEKLKQVSEGLRRCKSQYAVLVRLCGSFSDNGLGGGSIPAVDSQGSAAVLKELERKGIIEIFEVDEPVQPAETPRWPEITTKTLLTPPQQTALQSVRDGFADHDCVLLHGATGSGKTEIYIELMREMLSSGRSVLYLTPEIAMTSQLVMRVREVFGERVTEYHSQLSDGRRVEIYDELLRADGGRLIIGVRSSIFLPLNNLGLIIVDEEHDQNFKQTEPAPRYNARDCSVWLARTTECKCLLGSATPSIESWVNARSGKYGMAELPQRYGMRESEVIISDSIRARRRGERKLHFDKALTDAVRSTLEQGRQAVLYHPRRGYASWVECEECGWSARCTRCGVALTYHKGSDKLICHQCGNRMERIEKCPQCGHPEPRMNGIGTEQLEEEVRILFPGARVVRLDGDTTQNTARTTEMIQAFGRREADILIGTQLVSKGFDFEGVETVGVISADSMLNIADFRASERAFQQMMQVSGRGGHRGGHVVTVIQTSQPTHTIINQAAHEDYNGMVRHELEERRLFGYPPYSRLVAIRLRHSDEDVLQSIGEQLATEMRREFGEQVYGPHTPSTEKTGGKRTIEILLKIENGQSSVQAKRLLRTQIAAAQRTTKGLYIYCDVDPQ